MYATQSEHAAHLARLQKIRDRWLYDGEISADEKRRLIAEANAFYRGDRPRSLTPARTIVIPDEPAEPATLFEDEEEPLWWKRESA